MAAAGVRHQAADPPGHGSYQGLDLERLDPDDEDERTLLLEAQHRDMAEALERHEEMTGADGEPFNLRRLAGLPGDWPPPEELGHPGS